MLKRGQEQGLLRGIEMSSLSAPLTHIQFVDDTLIFSEASNEKIEHLLIALRCFEAISRLRINLNKSKILGVNVLQKSLQKFASTLDCRIDSFPTYFVGLPLSVGSLPKSMWERVTNARGRFLESMEKIRRDFLWFGKENQRKIHLLEWNQVCKVFREGVANVKILKLMNLTLLGKWAWRFASDQDALWSSIVRGKYGASHGNWWPKDKSHYKVSQIWKGILKAKNHVIANSRYVLGNGSATHF
ncbi:uncharacterized protein LOC131225741 [Magnolia sinica]|uniref:uncharacterized protein LOC131225741 n=1 Tax=Magnolia sinica TaxID=86752 RepID=UPI002657C489|nr:uncharacterized protein LOC131225741 [Magnolia sinica]